MPPRACEHKCCTSKGLKSCEIAPTAFVVWPPPCTEGNKARGSSDGRLIVKTAGSGLGEACREADRRPTCTWGRPGAIHGVTRLGAWSLRGIPCEGLQRGQGEVCALLDTSVKIPESSMGVCISTSSLPIVFTLLPWLCALIP